MDFTDVLDKLRSMIQIDIDAAHAYREALQNLENPSIKEKFTRFRRDHEMHIMELTSMVTSIQNEKAPEYNQEFTGFTTDTFTSPGESLEDILRAMQSNEKIVGEHYKDIVAIRDMPPEFHLVLDRYAKQEKKHLDYINKMLQEVTKKPETA